MAGHIAEELFGGLDLIFSESSRWRINETFDEKCCLSRGSGERRFFGHEYHPHWIYTVLCRDVSTSSDKVGMLVRISDDAEMLAGQAVFS